MSAPATITSVTRRAPALASLSPERRRLLALLGLAAVALAGLGWRLVRSRPDPRKSTIAIAYRLVATSDDGRPLADVALSIDGAVAARTDASGELTLPLRGRLGAVVALTVTCPASHAGSPTVPPVVMRPHRAIQAAAASAAGAARPAQALEASVVCDRGVRRAAVLVRVQVETTTTRRDARGRTSSKVDVAPLVADISLDGTPVTRTTDRGLAHLALERPAGSKVELEIKPASDELDPFVLPFDIADVDDVFVLERTLSRRVETAVARKPHRARRPEKRAVEIKAIPRSDAPFLDL